MPAGDMDSEYSIGVRNRFIGIDSDIIEDPLELIRAAQEKPKKEKEVKGKGSKKDSKLVNKGNKEKNVKIEPVQQSPSEVKSESTDRPRGRGRGRGRGGDRGRGRGGGGGSRGGYGFTPDDSTADGSNSAPRGPRGACHRCGEEGHFVRNCPQPKSPGSQPQVDGGFGNSGGFNAPFGGGSSFGSPNTGGFGGNDDDDKRGGRGGFRGRGGRGGRGRGGRGGGREFDRRSGSDKSSVKAFEKRDGSGSYNWGTAQDELAASEEQGGFGIPKETDETVVNETEEVQETSNASAGEDGETKENNAIPEISYEEWKRQQAEIRSKPQYNIRKANEGEKVKGMKQLKKPTEEENEADGSLFFPKKYIEEKLKTSGRVKETMNLDFQFTTGDNRHMDTGRRGRNRGRGGKSGRNKDESGGGFGSSKQIQLENVEEFPSL